jgi:membrane-associated phospholipid phosphatase
MLNLNEKIFLFISGGAGQYHSLDLFFLFVTNIWVPLLVGGSILYFFIALPFRRKNPLDRLGAYKLAGILGLSLFFVWTIVEFIKGMVAFPRPSQLLENLQTLSKFGSYDSFPSAHTAFAFAVATFIYHYSKPAGTLVFAMDICWCAFSS